MKSVLYVWRDHPDQHAFWKACGIETLQFCDTHWAKRDDRLDEHYATFAREVDSAHAAGFRVGMILFSNIAQWRGPAPDEPTGMGVLFDPRDPVARGARMASLARAVRALRACETFTLLAGDPGGAIGASFGPRTVDDFQDFSREVRSVVSREAPGAAFHLNPWAIAYWGHPGTSCETPDWWMHETRMSRQMLLEHPSGLRGVGVEVPGHTMYRPLALRHLRAAGIEPPDFPSGADVRALRGRGAPEVWAWPYFLLDEADDGDQGPSGRAVQIETRTIHRQIARLRRTGVDAVVGNWSNAGHKPRALNTYAFGRMVKDPSATPTRVIDEYAGAIADSKAGARALADVLRWIENDGNWQRKLPEVDRMPALPCGISTRADAQARLATVRPRTNPRFALAESPAVILDRLAGRLRPADPAEHVR
ncbi:MAG: hypothetical protein ACKO5K_13425 [Armatimonadota bacterium]